MSILAEAFLLFAHLLFEFLILLFQGVYDTEFTSDKTAGNRFLNIIAGMNGAEKLLGKGDMLFYPSGYPKPVRVQGSFVSDKEVQNVVDYLINHSERVSYNNELEEHMVTNIVSSGNGMQAGENGDDRDTYFIEAGKLIIEKEKASIGMLQRAFKIGFNRAARIMDQLCEAGAVGPEEGTKPRKVLMSSEEFEQYLNEKNG